MSPPPRQKLFDARLMLHTALRLSHETGGGKKANEAILLWPKSSTANLPRPAVRRGLLCAKVGVYRNALWLALSSSSRAKPSMPASDASLLCETLRETRRVRVAIPLGPSREAKALCERSSDVRHGSRSFAPAKTVSPL